MNTDTPTIPADVWLRVRLRPEAAGPVAVIEIDGRVAFESGSVLELATRLGAWMVANDELRRERDVLRAQLFGLRDLAAKANSEIGTRGG